MSEPIFSMLTGKDDCGNCGPYSVSNVVRASYLNSGWQGTPDFTYYLEGGLELEHKSVDEFTFGDECAYVIMTAQGANIINKNYFFFNGDYYWSDIPDGRLLLGANFTEGFGNGTTECFIGDMIGFVTPNVESTLYRLLKVNCDGSTSNFTSYIQYVFSGCDHIEWDNNRPGLQNPYTSDLSTFINDPFTHSPVNIPGFGDCLVFDRSGGAYGGPGTIPDQQYLDLVNPTVTYNFS